MGLSFGKFRRRAHLAYAAHLLLTTDHTMDAIAAEAGFVDGSHLHRHFVERYRTTPGEYRANTR
jgi:transcriptional regulator GlxA family with amidase domain